MQAISSPTAYICPVSVLMTPYISDLMSSRNRLAPLLWNYTQALRLLQHVTAHSIDHQIPLPSTLSALREFHLHLFRLDLVHRNKSRVQASFHSRYHTVGICVSRWLSVFPLSKAINWFLRYKAKRQGKEAVDELPYPYQAMLFWAGLRGAVGIALAAGLEGTNAPALRATVLVVVILTVIIFGGTTARMLEILGIRTGVC